jgi:UDP-N-acetylglucosamine acyltransferase
VSGASVHPTAIVGSGARLGNGVKVGPFCIVGDNVVLHDNVQLVSHVSIDGHTEVGADTRIFPFASIGHQPQDRKYHGEASRVVIGERCDIRESATINPGTEVGGMVT